MEDSSYEFGVHSSAVVGLTQHFSHVSPALVFYPLCHENDDHLPTAGTVLGFQAWQTLFAAYTRSSQHFSTPFLLPTTLASVQEAVWLASILSLDNYTPLLLAVHFLSPSCMG